MVFLARSVVVGTLQFSSLLYAQN